jgi:hypothetical protein
MSKKTKEKAQPCNDKPLKELASHNSIESYQLRVERLSQRADERLRRAFEILKEAAAEAES